MTVELKRAAGRIPFLVGAIVLGIGILVLLGWQLRLQTLIVGFWGGVTPMKPNSALCFIALGLALCLLAQRVNGRCAVPEADRVPKADRAKPQRLRQGLSLGLAVGVGLLGLLTLSEYLWGWDWGVDRLLFPEQTAPLNHGGRMGINTSLGFLLVSGALVLLSSCRSRLIGLGQLLSLAALLLCLQALIGHAFNVQVFYQANLASAAMASHTALTLLIYCGGLLSVYPQQGLMQAVTTSLDGGVLARQVLPAATLMPIGLGWLVVQGVEQNYYSPNFGMSILVSLSILVQSLILWQSVNRLNRNDLRRRRGEAVRQQALDDLQLSEARFRLLTESINDVFWLSDPGSQQLLYISSKYEQIWGRSCADLLTNWYEWIEAIHPDDRQRVQIAFQQQIRGQRTSEIYRILRPDGEIRWIRDRGYPMLDANGSVQYISGVAEDITERHKIEAERDGFFNLSLDLLCIAGTDGYFKRLNPAFERILGYSQAELLSQPFLEFVHPDDRDATLKELEKISAGEATLQFENRYRCKDGSYRWLDWATTPLVEENLMYAVGHDVTGRKQLEQQLRQSEARFRRLYEANTIGVVVGDFSGLIVEANDAFLQMVGYSRTDLQQGLVSWLGMTPPEYLPLDDASIVQVKRTGIGPTYEKEYLRKDGSRVPVLLGAALLPDSPEQAICFVLDLTDRKRAEQAVLDSEQRYRSLIEATSSLVWTTDAAGKFVTPQPLWEAYTGQRFTEYRDWGWGKALHPDDRERVQQQWTAALEARQIHQVEGRLWHAQTGEYRYFEAKAVPILRQDGSIREWVGTVNDVHDRRQAEAAVRASEAKLKSFVDADLIGILFGDIYGSILDANDELLRIVGYSREDLEAGRLSWLNITPPEYLPLDDLRIAEAQARGTCTPYEKEYIRKDGSRIPVLVGYSLIEPEREKSVAFILDITEQKRAEAALRESEARFRHLADHAPMLVWMTGTDKQAEYFNQAWLDFTGRSLGQELGGGWTAGLYLDDRSIVEVYAAAFDAREPFEMEYRLRRFDGEYRWLLNIGIPRFTPSGEFLGYIGSCVDIHDRKQAEADTLRLNELLELRVKERTAQLEAANKELESFSYSVSHDLRAPLRHISGFVDLLQKRLDPTNLDATAQRYLNIIAETTQQAGVLIDDLLAFSRMGRSEMRLITVDLNLLVQEIQRELEPELAQRQVIWQIAELPSVKADPAMLRLVVRNLIENAIKYTRLRPQTLIEIGSYSTAQDDVIFVKDNGIGFNMQYAHKLFGIFQRLHSDPRYEGTGIGLANVRRIIHRHGGKTWAEGALNEGATFFFSLPRLPVVQALECSSQPGLE
ncbi:MAG: PAS domain S-box protein, partial [Elainella sp.]